MAQGITSFIEIGPGRVLAGLVKRISKEVATVNVNNLEAVQALKG
jgi:[acyl-carrier-protein] S-malonyltransferase